MQHRQYTYKPNNEGRSRNHFSPGKAKNITHAVHTSVALGILLAKRLRSGKFAHQILFFFDLRNGYFISTSVCVCVSVTCSIFNIQGNS